MLVTHRHLALLGVATTRPSEALVHNFFIFRADENNPSSSSLRVLPLVPSPSLIIPAAMTHAAHREPPGTTAPTLLLCTASWRPTLLLCTASRRPVRHHRDLRRLLLCWIKET
uniref:Uncharacterized protein n=1 Tax=Setaria viridis TaxID=4556 RepID=A0A4U6W6Y8_SETVI|nr:hypothetical protein SEVIR_1G113066v2 [Setaria viridis]